MAKQHHDTRRWRGAPSALSEKKTLEERMEQYKSLLQHDVERDRDTLFLQTLQNQNELVQMLYKENQKLNSDKEELSNKVAELLKDNSALRVASTSHRLDSNYPRFSPNTNITSHSQKELNRVTSANSAKLPPLSQTSPTLEADAREMELKEVKEEKRRLEDLVEKLKTENEKLKEEISDVKNSKSQLNVQLNDVEKTLKDALQGLDAAQREAEGLKKESKRLQDALTKLRNPGYGQSPSYFSGFRPPPPPKIVNVQLVSRQMGSHGDALADLAAQVTESLLQQNLRANFVQSEVASDVRPLIVVCVRALRLGTDVNEALSGVNRDTTVGLVVLHHQGAHIRQCDQTEKQLSSEISNLGLVVDVVFWKEQRVYKCDINSTAITRLGSYLAQFAK